MTGRAQGAVSLGHTGAMMAAATLHMRRIPGVQRPGIAVVLPSRAGFIVLLDAGANADARPEHLLQFAIMGRLFAQGVLGDPAPRVGLLSIGEEEGRGSELIQQATPLLRETPGFIGNVEGRDIPRGTARVVVTDGFTGNVALKLYEASGEFLFSEMRAARVGDPDRAHRRPARPPLDPPHAPSPRPGGRRRCVPAGRARALRSSVTDRERDGGGQRDAHRGTGRTRADVVDRLAAELGASPGVRASVGFRRGMLPRAWGCPDALVSSTHARRPRAARSSRKGETWTEHRSSRSFAPSL